MTVVVFKIAPSFCTKFVFNQTFFLPGWQWGLDKKQHGVNILYRLSHLNLALLFDPPVVEEDLVNCIANCLFR